MDETTTTPATEEVVVATDGTDTTTAPEGTTPATEAQA